MGHSANNDLKWLLDQDLTTEDLEWEHRLDISASVYKRMEEIGINKSELARRLGVANSQVSRILSGGRNMTLRTLAALEKALDFRLDSGFRYYERKHAASHVILAECNPMASKGGTSLEEWTWEVPGRDTMPGYLDFEGLDDAFDTLVGDYGDLLMAGDVA